MKKIIITVFVLFIISTFAFVTWVSVEPEQKNISEIVSSLNIDNPKDVIGEASTGAIDFTVQTLLNKNGGYTYNDLLAQFGVFDNMPNWEVGVLIQARDALVVMTNDLSRSQSQSIEDKNLKEARSKLHYDNNKWIYLYRTEGEYRDSHKFLIKYLNDIVDPNVTSSQFYARSDNLREWLNYMSKRLGSLSQRLSASVEKERVNTDLANDPSSQQSTSGTNIVQVKTSWLELDDVFWESRGSAWALLHYMKAIRVDFELVLEDKNALASVDQVIKELESSQSTVWSPFILNGSGFGFVANHSLAMANYLSRANAAMIDLRSLLKQG